jgi:hypothetical protein
MSELLSFSYAFCLVLQWFGRLFPEAMSTGWLPAHIKWQTGACLPQAGSHTECAKLKQCLAK